jgi:ADP-ribosyl-[dinitrogen reductase] hydrolase
MSTILKDKCVGLVIGCALGDCMGSVADFKHQEKNQDPVTSPEESEGYWNEATSLLLCQSVSLSTDVPVMTYIQDMITTGWGTSNGEVTNLSKATIDKAKGFKILKPCKHNTDCLLLMGALAIGYYRDYENGHVEAFMNPLASGCRLCMDACKFFYSVLDLTLHGGTKLQILNPKSYENLLLCPEVKNILEDLVDEDLKKDNKGEDHVIDSIETVMKVFSNTWSYEEGVRAIVNVSVAPVRTGALLGQLCGAYYGLTDIKEDWIDLLQRKDLLRRGTQCPVTPNP